MEALGAQRRLTLYQQHPVRAIERPVLVAQLVSEDPGRDSRHMGELPAARTANRAVTTVLIAVGDLGEPALRSRAPNNVLCALPTTKVTEIPTRSHCPKLLADGSSFRLDDGRIRNTRCGTGADLFCHRGRSMAPSAARSLRWLGTTARPGSRPRPRRSISRRISRYSTAARVTAPRPRRRAPTPASPSS